MQGEFGERGDPQERRDRLAGTPEAPRVDVTSSRTRAGSSVALSVHQVCKQNPI